MNAQLLKAVSVAFQHVSGAAINTRSMTADGRLLVVAGYGGLISLLALFLSARNLALGTLTSSPSGAANLIVSVDVVTYVAAGAGYVIGWALVFTGATDAGRIALCGALVAFVVLSFALGPYAGMSSLVLAIPAFVLFVWSRDRTDRWRRLPWLELLLWTLGTAGTFGLGMVIDQNPARLASVTSLVVSLAAPIWLLLGIDTIDVAVRIARSLVSRIRPSYRPLIKAAVPVVIVAVLAVLLTLRAVFRGPRDWFEGFVGLSFMGVLVIAVVAIVVAVLRRWSENVALVTLATLITTLIASLALSVAVRSGAELEEVVLGGFGMVPSEVLFAGLLTYNVAAFAPRYADTEGRRVPRSARVLIYLGAVIVVIGSTLYQSATVQTPEPRFDAVRFLHNGYISGLFLLGFPYLLWICLTRRERLIGVNDRDSS
jgi:hypothetical protein